MIIKYVYLHPKSNPVENYKVISPRTEEEDSLKKEFQTSLNFVIYFYGGTYLGDINLILT